MTIEAKTTETAAPRIRLGMVGGGAGAFIGGVHRMAARLDNRFELVAGALSSSAEKAQAWDVNWGWPKTASIPATRTWPLGRRG